MEVDTGATFSKHKRSRDKGDREHKKKRHRSDKDTSKHKSKTEHKTRIVDDDVDDEDMWMEKNIDMDGEKPIATNIPSADSLKITSRATIQPGDPPLPQSVVAETALKRDEWMLDPSITPPIPATSSIAHRAMDVDESLTEDYGESSGKARTTSGGVDFFSSLGTERKKKPDTKLEEPRISHKELNTALKEGKSPDEYTTPAPKAVTPGGPGSQWRMMRLRRVFETAEEDGRPIEEVALERFGSLDEFEKAKEERQILDERQDRYSGRSDSRKGKGREGESVKGFMFNDLTGSAGSSRSSSFRRPDLGAGTPTPSTPSPVEGTAGRGRASAIRRQDQGGTGSPLAQVHTPVPSVMAPAPHLSGAGKRRALSPSSLNKLQAKVLRAKLMSAPNAATLEKEYDVEVRRAHGEDVDGDSGVQTRVEVLPTLDAHGRLYDVGQGRDDAAPPPGNRRKDLDKVDTRDPKTGEVIRVNADDDEVSLGEMLRQERFGAGAADQKDLDAQFARAIATDGGFKADLDYMDENADKLARQKMRSDAMKRQFAINDYKRTQKVLASCKFCFGEDDSPPKAPVIAMGTRVYLSCTMTEPLVEGHCLIVPIQHHLAMLEGDDDVWDEVRNFMKSLMRMFAAEDKGVLFYETVISLKKQLHTYIECVPLAWEHFDQVPGYFKESILMSEMEWSQHKKLIDFSARPGGFRRAMVPNLPYFMVQFDYKGEKGYGHVIEGVDDAAGDEDGANDEGEKGGGEFPRYFAGEIVGNLLDIEPRVWRHPRRVDSHHNKDRAAKFKEKYDQYDWTGLIGQS